MPITQDRMHRLLETAEDISASYLFLAGRVGGLVLKFKREELPLADLLLELETLTARPEVDIALQVNIVNEERFRYRYTHNKNEKEKLRLEKRRAENQGLTVEEAQARRELAKAQRKLKKRKHKPTAEVVIASAKEKKDDLTPDFAEGEELSLDTDEPPATSLDKSALEAEADAALERIEQIRKWKESGSGG